MVGVAVMRVMERVADRAGEVRVGGGDEEAVVLLLDVEDALDRVLRLLARLDVAHQPQDLLAVGAQILRRAGSRGRPGSDRAVARLSPRPRARALHLSESMPQHSGHTLLGEALAVMRRAIEAHCDEARWYGPSHRTRLGPAIAPR